MLANLTGRENERTFVNNSSVTADQWLTSARPDNGCYGRQPLKPNSLAHLHHVPPPGDESTQAAVNCRPVRVPRWPGIDTLIVAYQRYIHGNYHPPFI